MEDSSENNRWLTYREASRRSGWSVESLRRLVSQGQIPVFGPPRMRRFRMDLLDLYVVDREAAMRRFRGEKRGGGLNTDNEASPMLPDGVGER